MRIIGAAALGAVLLAGATAQAADNTWRHAIIAAKADSGELFMVGKGFADQQGLKLELTQVDNDGLGLKALIAGQVDTYEGSPARCPTSSFVPCWPSTTSRQAM